MAKTKSIYTCTECGGQAVKWQGQCPHCTAWNTLVETIAETATAAVSRFSAVAGSGKLQRLNEVEAREESRLPTGIAEFDRVLGGGLMHGAVVLLGGDPGIGKSTLLLQAEKPVVAVIDSIQTVYSEALQSAPGSVAQVRECAAQLTRVAKQTGITMIFVGHVTKEGALAGPRVLEHIVDTVLYFEGDTHSSSRLIRSVKNRFGAVNELGVFAMTEKGLKGVANPSALFLSQHAEQVAGSCVLVTQEGTRPLLVEIQALVDDAHAPSARRLGVGLEQNRLALLLAVLHRHAGIACFDQDVFINAVGGMKIVEPAADLAVLMAIVSSLTNRPLPARLVVFGEVGLAGEVRPVQRGQERLREAAKLGFTHALIPEANKPRQPIPGLQVIAVRRVADAVARMRDGFSVS